MQLQGDSNTILITGVAGFIGYHMAKRLLDSGHTVVGIDNMNSYYDVSLKEARLAILANKDAFQFYEQDLNEKEKLESLFSSAQPQVVIHLAAQAGVRYSLEQPFQYVTSNVEGFLSILEACRRHPVKHLLYASSSSVYGDEKKLPFREDMKVDQPVSLYAATKKADELMAYTYSHLYGIPATGLRFFTVYGPWGRPDMAYYRFAEKIMAGEGIDVYNYGKMRRDFTYVDDITQAMEKLLEKPPQKVGKAPHEIYNIGNAHPEELLEFIEILENKLGKKAQKNLLPMQSGDVETTYADTGKLEKAIGYRPTTGLEEGLDCFVNWFKGYWTMKED